MSPRIQIAGNVAELSEDDFLILVDQIVGAGYILAEEIYAGESAGFPDGNTLKPLLADEVGLLTELEAHIKDEELRNLVRAFKGLLQKQIAIDDQMVEWVREFMKIIEIPQLTESRRRKLRARWIGEARYRAFVREIEQVMSEMLQAKQQIYQRALQILPDNKLLSPLMENVQGRGKASKKNRIARGVSEEEMQIEDLIDEAHGETDPRRAIGLLRKALRRSRRDVDIRKICIELGMRFEQLGNNKMAILNYTKAIEAGMPTPHMFFWRGRLYYSQGELDKARADLERAISLSSPTVLSKPEREEAEHLLRTYPKNS